MINHDK